MGMKDELKVKHLTLYLHTCIECGKVYKNARLKGVYCSPECLANNRKKIYAKAKIIKICPACGIEFMPKRKETIYCNSHRIKPKQELVSKECKYCGKVFEGSKLKQYCSKECYQQKYFKQRALTAKPKAEYQNICKQCCKPFTATRASRQYCGIECSNRSHTAERARKQPYRKQSAKDKRAFRYSIGQRDNWICGVCGQQIDKELKYPNPQSASLRHIQPLSKGGTHSKDNVQIVHLHCNSAINTPPAT